MRRVDRAAREDDLARSAHLPLGAVLAERDPDAAAAVEEEAGGDRAGLDLEVGPPFGCREEGARGRTAHPSLAGHLRIADAFLGLAVVIRGPRKPGLLRRRDEGVGQGQDRAVILDNQRPALAAKFRVAALDVALRF